MAEIINFLLIAGAIQGFGFNLVTLFVKKKFDKTIIFLNLTVLFISLNNLQSWLRQNDYSSNLFLIENLLVPWYMFIMPMFYAFTIYFIRVQNKVNNFIKPTIIIFVVEIIIRLCLISVDYYNDPNGDAILTTQYTLIENSFNLFYSLFLFANTCLLIFKRHHLLNYILSFDDLNWIKWIIRLGIAVFVTWIIALAIQIITDDHNVDAYKYLNLSTSILLYWMGYYGFYKYNVVNDRISLRSTIETDKVLITSSNYIKSNEQEDDFFNEKHQKDFDKIKDHIIKNKLYLDPLLSMEVIADELRMSKSYISKLINSYSDYNFSDFVNSLRVEQAKKFLSNDEFSNYTIVAIGLECGFNSKSTFYSAFKKFTSETPSTFRAQY